MDMLPPVTSPSFIQHNQCLAMSSMNVASENMLAASAHLHKLHDVEPTEVINVAVTCDGTWYLVPVSSWTMASRGSKRDEILAILLEVHTVRVDTL